MAKRRTQPLQPPAKREPPLQTARTPDIAEGEVAEIVDVVLPRQDIGNTIEAFVTRGPLAATARRVAALDWVFGGTGAQATLLRAVDWTTTSIGAVEDWSPELQAVVRLAMSADMPIGLMLGKDLTFFVNDAGAAMLGGKAAESGRPYFQIYPEIKKQLGPVLDAVFLSGETIFSKDALFLFDSNGRVEEQYHTSANIPITTRRGIEGVFCPGVDSTDTVLGARRMRTLAKVAAVPRTRDVNAAFVALLEALDGNPNDVPFAIAYEIDAVRRQATLKSTLHVESGSAIAPYVVDLPSPHGAWPFGHVFETGAPLIVSDLPGRFATAKLGPWPDPTSEALVYPIAGSPPRGMFVVGLNRMRLLDPPYRDFLDLLAAQINAGILEAEAFTASRKRVEALAEIDRAKTVFFSNVSHEFRTPLTLLLGPLQEALADPQLGHRPELAVAHRNALRLQKLVNSLLDFARIEAGRIDAAYEPTDLGSLTADLASAFRSAVERAGLRLRIDCPPLQEPAYVDREMWEKIVLNLVSNAFKFTFEGEIAVSLREDDGRLALTVRDTGVGIPEKELPRIFERFHRVRDTRARTVEGSGIGLSLVQELVRLHGGTISVASSVDDGLAGGEHGTTFTVSIPAGSAHLPAERIHAASALLSTATGPAPFVEEALRWLPGTPPETEPIPAGQSDGSPHLDVFGEDREARVLVADDNADMRDYLARLLGRHWTIEAVADGQTALDRARGHPPDLVLTDVMMPGLDGFGLLRELRADPALTRTPILLLSARAGEESRVEGMSAGADDYLVKPFSARELVTRVGARLALARQRRRVEETLRTREERNAFFLKLADALRSLTDAAQIEQTTCRLLGEHLRVDRAYYVDIDEGAGIATVSRQYLREGAQSSIGVQPLDAFGWSLPTMRRGEMIVVDDIHQSEVVPAADVAAMETVHQAAILAAPIVRGDLLVAVLCVTQTVPRTWKPEEVELVRDVMQRTWAAVERARAEAALRASEERQAFLLALTDALRPLDAAAEIQGEATRLLREHLAAGWCYYVEWDEAAARGAVLRDATREGLPSLAGTHDVSDAPTFIDTLRKGNVLNVGDYASFDELSPTLRARYTALGFRSMLVATLVKQGRLVASLIVGDTAVREWSGDAEALLMEVAERTWAAVERAGAEAALRKSEEKYRTLFNSIDEGYALVELERDENGMGKDLVWREVNPAFVRQNGAIGIVGKRASEFVPNTERSFLAVNQEVADTGVPRRIETYNSDLGRWFDAIHIRVGGEGSNLLGVVFTDITERKLREQQNDFLLKLSDALRPLADPAHIKFEAARVLGEELGVNRAIYAEVGDDNWWAARGYVRDVDPLPTGSYPSDTYAHWIMQTYRRGESLVFEDVRADSRFTEEQRAAAENASIIGAVGVPLVKSGELVALLSVHTAQPHKWTAHEIAIVEETAERTWAAVERAKAEEALRASEERLRTVIESIQDYLIITLDSDGRITSWNDGARRMTGYEPDEVLGGPIDRLYDPQDVAAGKPAHELQRAIETGRSEDESWRVRKDGSRLWVNEIVRPLRDNEGGVNGFAKISRDLTERKAFEDALQQARDSLEARVRERTGEVQALFTPLVSAQEEERRRIARDIHDQVGQQMTAMRINLEALRSQAAGRTALVEQAERTQLKNSTGASTSSRGSSGRRRWTTLGYQRRCRIS